MKKFILILLAVCLLLGCVIGYAVSKNGAKGSGEPVALYDPENVPAAAAETEAPAPAAETAPDESAGSEPSAVRSLDYGAIRALHAPDEIVGSVDGRDVSWDEFFYWLHDVGIQAEQ